MTYRIFLWIVALSCLANTVLAQESPSQRTTARQLAPGVLTVVGVESEEAETYTNPRQAKSEEAETDIGPPQLVELVSRAPNWDPNFTPINTILLQLANKATIRRTIWQFEFSFKPMRLIYLNVTDGRGETRRQPVWYLLYHLRNKGQHLEPTPEDDEFGNAKYRVAHVDRDLKFVPQFGLRIRGEVDGRSVCTRIIPDRVMPTAVGKIHQTEIRDPTIRLYNSVDISTISIKSSTDELDRGVWGVATWRDVDPRTDYFSVYVKGLTNAYRWEIPNNDCTKWSAPGTEAEYTFKTLKLNFWRPGDTVREHVREFRLGLPLTENKAEQAQLMDIFHVKGRADHSWVYLP